MLFNSIEYTHKVTFGSIYETDGSLVDFIPCEAALLSILRAWMILPTQSLIWVKTKQWKTLLENFSFDYLFLESKNTPRFRTALQSCVF